MTGPDGALDPYLVIALMAVATYLCRVSGAVLMSRVRITPRLERALRALPGSIVVATVLPLAVAAGPVAFLGLGAAIGVMALLRYELAALVAGLGTVALARAAGL